MSAKAWTEVTTPIRVNVVAHRAATAGATNPTVRTAAGIDGPGGRWRAAAPASHATSPADSMGSQAQYPPHPSSTLAHSAPVASPTVSAASGPAIDRVSDRVSSGASPVVPIARRAGMSRPTRPA